MKKGILALLVVFILAALITPGIIGHLAEQGIHDSLEWIDSENDDFIITSAQFESGWFSSAGQHRIEFLVGNFPVVVVNTRLDHGLIPVSSMFRENGSLLPGLGSAVSSLDLELSDGSVEELPITIYANIGLSGALQSQLIIEPGGLDTANERFDWGGSVFQISSNPSDQSFAVKGAFTSFAVKSENETTIVGKIDIDLDLAATPYGYMVGPVQVALDSVSVISAEQTMTAGPISVDSHSALDGDRINADIALNIENTPMVLGGTGSMHFVGRLENADAAAFGDVMRSLADYGYEYRYESAELENNLLSMLAGGMELHFDQLDILSPFGQITSRFSAVVGASDADDYTWLSALPLLNASTDISLPEALVDMATSSNPDMHASIGMGFLRKQGEYYVMEASFDDSLLTVNGAPMPIPLSGL